VIKLTKMATSDCRARPKRSSVIIGALMVGSLTLPCNAQESLPDLGARIEFIQTMQELVSNEIARRQTPLVFDRSAPPAANQAVQAEARIKARWMTSVVQQAAESYQHARRTNDPTVRGVWLRDAALKADTAHRLVKYYLGDDVDMRRPNAEAKRRIERVGTQATALATATKEVAEAWIQNAGRDSASARVFRSKQAELEAAVNRQVRSLQKANAATFVAEANFWLRNSDLQDEKIRRLSVELMSGVTSSPEDAKILPELAQALRGNDPAARKQAIALLDGMVDKGWGPKVLPKLVELLSQHPVERDASMHLKGGIFSQTDRQAEQLAGRIPPDVAYEQSLQQNRNEFNKTGGISGAGGVSLHAAVRFVPAIDPKRATRAYIDENRLVLLYDGRPIQFPKLDPEYLALALRNIIGMEGAIRGTLVHDASQGIVIQTPKDQFGQVVWKKEFLPSPWKPVEQGESITVLLGPAFGLSPTAGVSIDRATYYGTIANTRLGRVLFDADAVLATLTNGIDIHTGRMIDLACLPGFATDLERRLKADRRSQPRSGSRPTRGEDATSSRRTALTPWPGTWLVWVPGQFDLRLTGDASQFRFTHSRMKLAVWSMDETSVDPSLKELGEEATRRFDELAAWRPVLKQLVEVAKAVTIVRWLQQAEVPTDLDWARAYEVESLKTPSTITRYRVVFDPAIDLSRIRPQVEKHR